MIHVSYRGELATLTGCAEEPIEAARVRDVLRWIRQKHGAAALKEAKKMLIVVDQKSITLLQNFKTELPEGCTVGFLPVCGGG